MSGGDLGYAYFRVEEVAEEIKEQIQWIEGDARQKRVLEFCDHLELVKKALHDIEWVLGGDYGADGADEAIDDVLPKFTCYWTALDSHNWYERGCGGCVEARLVDFDVNTDALVALHCRKCGRKIEVV